MRTVPGSNQGYTLMEVMLVLVIMGMIAAIVIPVYSPSVDKAKAEAHKANLMQIERAVRLYFIDNGRYPVNIEELVNKSLTSDKWQGPYLKVIPIYPYDANKNYEVVAKGKIVIQ